MSLVSHEHHLASDPDSHAQCHKGPIYESRTAQSSPVRFSIPPFCDPHIYINISGHAPQLQMHTSVRHGEMAVVVHVAVDAATTSDQSRPSISTWLYRPGLGCSSLSCDLVGMHAT